VDDAVAYPARRRPGRIGDDRASKFPRHWLYDDAGRLTGKSGLTDFRDWASKSFGRHTPWGNQDSPALVTAVETALEQSLSVQLMRGSVKPRVARVPSSAARPALAGHSAVASRGLRPADQADLKVAAACAAGHPCWLSDRPGQPVIASLAVMAEAWTAPQVERTDPGRILDERQALEAWLDFHRDTLLRKCAGLTASQLKEGAVPPSRLSLLGLVRHMTEVERWWFRMHAAGADLPFPYDPDQTGLDFEALDDADAAANFEAFRQETELARAAVAGRQLDDVVSSRGDHPERTRNIRWIYLHMIEEYARHNGHADLIRERIDGVTGD
jgi:uncharacterized damage-inducible protein DinB